MSHITRRQALAAGLALGAPGFTVTAFAQTPASSFPSRPVTLVVPFTPGSGSDTISRIISPRLAERWKQAVVVENRAGASGNLGADRVAKAAPDGLTLLMAINTFTMTPAMYKSLPYNPVADFTPVSRLATANFALVVNSDVPAKDVKSLVAWVKSQPAGKLNYGSPGNGTPHHLGMELMKSSVGMEVVHVPYKGISGALTDLLGGQVQMMFASFHSVLPNVRAGKLRMLGLTGPTRSPLLPDVPTFREQGLTVLEAVDNWYAVMGPAGMTPTLIDRVHKDFVEVMQEPEVRSKLAEQGLTIQTSSPGELRDVIASDLARWKKVVADARIQAE
ncbi:MAG: tripartite tricarboxylate transporter substrate binding protein [Pseudomonadota bacterium]